MKDLSKKKSILNINCIILSTVLTDYLCYPTKITIFIAAKRSKLLNKSLGMNQFLNKWI